MQRSLTSLDFIEAQLAVRFVVIKEAEAEAIKKGLRRSVFKPPSNNNKYATKLDLVPEEIKSRISDTKSSF
jgi:hypothetical protein